MAPVTCGLYVGSETLSLLALQPAKKGWTVHGGAADFHALGENDDLGPALKALGKPLKLSKPEVTAILPKQQAILRDVLLPSVDRDELAQMSRFEAERHIPFHAERHSTGYHVMRSLGVEGSEVLLAAVDGPIVQRLLDGAIAAGMRPQGASLSSVGLMNTLLYHRKDWIKNKTVAIVSLGLDTVDLVLATEGRVLFARSASMDLRGLLEDWAGQPEARPDAARPDMARLAMAARMIDCTDLDGNYGNAGGAPSQAAAERVRAWIDHVIQELRRTYDFARREMKCPPIDALALTGEGALLRNLAQYLFVNLNVEVAMLNPIEGLTRKGQKFSFDGFEFAIPFGGAIAAQMEGAYRIDLTPHEHYRALGRKRLTRQLIQTGLLAAVTAGLGIAAYLHFDDIRTRQINAYAEFNEKVAGTVQVLKERQTKLGIIDNFMKDPNSALNVLAAIAGARSIPQHITLGDLNYTKSGVDENGTGTVEIGGDARTIEEINTFMQELEQTNRFYVSRTQSPERTQLYDQPLYTFKLECTLKGGGKSRETGKGTRP